DFTTKVNAIQPTKGDHPNVLKGIETLRQIASEEHEARVKAEQASAEVLRVKTELEEKLKKPIIPDEVTKELEDLRELRRNVDIRLDPEFQAKYIQGLQNTEATITKMLKDVGVKDETMLWIKEHGGVLKMSGSMAPADEKTTEADWVENTLLPSLPTVLKNRIINKLTDGQELQENMVREINENMKGSSERQRLYVEKNKQEFEAGRDAAVAAAGDLAKVI